MYNPFQLFQLAYAAVTSGCRVLVSITPCAVAVASLLFVGSANAQVTFNSGSRIRVASAPDYARDVLNNPWDMNDAQDLANFIPDADIGGGITNRSFSGGVFSFTIPNADGAFFHLLSPGQCSTNPLGKNGQAFPIDTTKYRYLTIRMNTNVGSELRALWYTSCDYSSHFARTVPIGTSTGWHTYTIDLATIALETNNGVAGGWGGSPATGLRIDPGYSGDIAIDWIMLSATAPGASAVIDHSFTAIGNDSRYSLFLDTDTNPQNGFLSQLVTNAGATTPVSLGGQNLFPGSYQLVGIATDDYATLQGNPWDMGSNQDTWISSGIVNTSFSGGQFNGTTANGDPWFFLSNFTNPIDTSIFHMVSLKMTVSSTHGASIAWGNAAGSITGIHYFTANAGTHVYTFDLSSIGTWSGNVSRIRISPGGASGVDFSVDFVSVRQNNFVATLDDPTPVVQAGGFVVNQPPRIDIQEPNARGGEDYATAVLGNPWNFDGSSDLVSVNNISLAEILPNNYVNGLQGDFFHGRNVNNNPDPYQTSLNLATTSPLRIDASRYKNLAYKAYIATPQDVTNGSVARIIWQSTASGDATPRNGDDQITFAGWNEYIQDMTNVALEPVIHPPGSYTNPIWHGLANMFRVDIHEFTPATDFYIDYLHLTADDETNTKFAIAYDGLDSDDLASNVDLSLYYGTSKQTSGGTLITNSLSLSDNSRIYEWDTSGVADGTYYVYGVADDGTNQSARLASGRLIVNHSRAQNSSAPVINLSYPSNGGGLYDSTLVSGYALDDIKVATIEVLVDNALVSTLHPSLFNKGARTAYPSYSWSSNAGFYEAVDFSSVAAGAHQLELKAWDTAGNHSSSIVNIIKQAGSDPNPPSAPAQDNEAAQAISTVPAVLAKFSVKQNNGANQIVATIQNTAGCDTLKLIASDTSATITTNPLAATVVKTLTGAAKKQSFTAIGLKSLKPKSTVYYGLSCNDTYMTKTLKSTKPFQLASKSKVKTVASWLAQFSKKLKVTKVAKPKR